MNSLQLEDPSQLQDKRSMKKYILPLCQSFFFQLISGINDANLGIILPFMQVQYNLSQYVVSVVFLASTAGYLIAALGNGFLTRKFGYPNTSLIGCASLFVGYLVCGCPVPFAAQCIFLVFVGFGLALIQSCANVICGNMPRPTIILNFLHAFYGFGALIGPLIASSVSNWRTTYRIFCALAALAGITSMFALGRGKVRRPGVPLESDDEGTASRGLLHETLHQPIIYAGALFLLFYVGTEVLIGNWGFTFLLDTRSDDTVAMAHVMTGYWSGICFGRLALGWLTLKFGEKRMIYGYVLVLIAMLLLLWLVPAVGVSATALVIIGIAIGPLFPTTISLTTKIVPSRLQATTIGFLAAFGSGGSAIFPYLGGVLIGSAGIGALLPFCISMAAMLFVTWIWVPNPGPSLGFGFHHLRRIFCTMN
ncbi:major facilitator superfamily MFS_1 [Gongronella butleri]|nr:major facilitator superfamily MFS_1 [Gongronella butleri]